MTAEANFRRVAPIYMRRLLSDFPTLDATDAAAIFGNLGYESIGFSTLQEIKPTVAGSRGGWGWAQWTGPRRRAFEAYCARTGKDPGSHEANYAYLFVELKGIEGSERGAVAKTAAAFGLPAKVEAFERAFLRAGVKNYESRLKWARIAVDAFRADDNATAPTAPAPPIPTPTRPIEQHEEPIAPPPAKTERKGIPWWVWGIGIAAALGAAAAFIPLPF